MLTHCSRAAKYNRSAFREFHESSPNVDVCVMLHNSQYPP